MKTNDEIRSNSTPKLSLKASCQALCRKLLAQINNTKEQLFSEFKEYFGPEEHVLRLALNEAEALAWQTDYPHLLFPELAAEKAEAAAKWEQHQQILKNGQPLSRT